jgi:hypothetical protein
MQPVNWDGRTVLITSCGADENYAATFGLKVLSGSCFAQSGGFIPNQIVLNESAVKALGLTVNSAINRQIKVPSSGTILTIAGVINDFNYSSLQDKVEPLAFFHVKDEHSIVFKIGTNNIVETVAIRNKWRECHQDSI